MGASELTVVAAVVAAISGSAWRIAVQLGEVRACQREILDRLEALEAAVRELLGGEKCAL